MTLSVHLESSKAYLFKALNERRFFKLIGGGSFTDVTKIAHLVKVYTLAGVDCIDVAPDPDVINIVAKTLEDLPLPHPMVMVSIPLDPDPHFRKIDLLEEGCIECGLCLPPCPAQAITLSETLEISQTLCYGCGRCVPVCPTNALSLLPFHVETHIDTVLRHPVVGAVEIHTRMLDSDMLLALFTRWKDHLSDKILSLCFQPRNVPPEQLLDFYRIATENSQFPVILQMDGAPMSGDEEPDASLPAMEAALYTVEVFEKAGKPLPHLTISGGINCHTADKLQVERYLPVSGVGMGTMARKTVWSIPESEAVQKATNLVSMFK